MMGMVGGLSVYLLFTGNPIWMNADLLLRSTINCFPSCPSCYQQGIGGPFVVRLGSHQCAQSWSTLHGVNKAVWAPDV